jgi:hypothetical protein
LFTQERLNPCLDLLSFVFGTSEPERKVVTISHVFETAVVRVVRVAARQAAELVP